MDNYSLNEKKVTFSPVKGITSIHGRPVNMQVAGRTMDTLINEGGSAFLDYVNRLGLARQERI
jgi:hypothetical protein